MLRMSVNPTEGVFVVFCICSYVIMSSLCLLIRTFESAFARKNKKNEVFFGFLLAYSYLCSRYSENPMHSTT